MGSPLEFPGIAATSQYLDAYVIVPLIALTVVQVLEPKIPALATTEGRMLWILLKLALCYLLIGFTGAIQIRSLRSVSETISATLCPSRDMSYSRG